MKRRRKDAEGEVEVIKYQAKPERYTNGRLKKTVGSTLHKKETNPLRSTHGRVSHFQDLRLQFIFPFTINYNLSSWYDLWNITITGT
jgi:hypothetical protein